MSLTGEFERKLGGLKTIKHNPMSESEMANSLYNLIFHANKEDKGYRYIFQGDLRQMSEQKEFLQNEGFDIGLLDVYPAVKTEEEFNRALKRIWECKVPGWWHYKNRMISLGICTEGGWRV
jgi:hypothetical protein